MHIVPNRLLEAFPQTSPRMSIHHQSIYCSKVFEKKQVGLEKVDDQVKVNYISDLTRTVVVIYRFKTYLSYYTLLFNDIPSPLINRSIIHSDMSRMSIYHHRRGR